MLQALCEPHLPARAVVDPRARAHREMLRGYVRDSRIALPGAVVVAVAGGRMRCEADHLYVLELEPEAGDRLIVLDGAERTAELARSPWGACQTYVSAVPWQEVSPARRLRPWRATGDGRDAGTDARGRNHAGGGRATARRRCRHGRGGPLGRGTLGQRRARLALISRRTRRVGRRRPAAPAMPVTRMPVGGGVGAAAGRIDPLRAAAGVCRQAGRHVERMESRDAVAARRTA